MNRLHTLRAELSALQSEAKGILARAKDDELEAADAAAFDALEEKIVAKKAEIEAQETKERRLAAVKPLASVPAGQSVTDEPNPETTFGFRSLAEFAASVRSASRAGGMFDDRLRAAPASPHTGGGTAGEGFEVPPQFRDSIWELVSDVGGMFERTDLEPTNRRQVEAGADQTTPWGASGVQAYWRSEGSKMTESQIDTEGRVITLHELYAFVTATDELLEDSPRLEARLGRKSAEALAWKIDDAVIYGTGAGQPLGWMNSGALVEVAKESGQSADTLLVDNITKMYARLLRVPGDRPFWMLNSDTLPQLINLKIGDTPIWLPPNGLAGAPNGMILGLPVEFSEHGKTLGDKGDIQLVSPKGYNALRRTAGVSFASSMHLFFDYATTAYRWTFRFGGQPHLRTPISPANGSATKSHFVTLAERA